MSPHPELARWKAIRAAYPGWLILPERNRTDLLHEIQGRSYDGLANSLIHGKLSDWQPDALLDAWSEFNWGMERVLFPLRPEWATQIEDILHTVVPFPELAIAAEKSFNQRLDLRQPWIELAIAMLRHHREFRHKDAFFTWLGHLAPLEADWDIVHHQRTYQSALWHITFMDDKAALDVLHAWKAERGCDPYWLARKAGLLAELGEWDEAKGLWRDAIRRLQGVRGEETPFYATSRESAILSIQSQLQFLEANDDRRDINDRIRVLSSFDGLVPWDVIHALTPPDPDYREKLEDTEQNSGSLHFTGGPWRPESGIQCLRLIEELGFPLYVPNPFPCSLGAMAALRNSFADLALASGDLGGTSFLRLRNPDYWKKFEGSYVAAIPDPFLNELKTACDNAWRQIEQPGSLAPHLGESRVSRACGLLQIIQWRLDDRERQQWVERVLAFAEGNPASRRFRNAKAIADILPDITVNLLPGQVSEMLGRLLRFPLPEEASSDPRFWPSPFTRLRAPSPKPTITHALRQCIERLVDMVPNSKEAINRLAWLAASKLLPDRVKPRLAKNLWGDSGSIPTIYPLYPWALLQLPEPQKGFATEALKRSFLDNPTPDLRQKTDDGRFSISFGGPDWCLDLHQISRPYRWEGRPYIDWAAEDADTLLKHIEDWWEREGRELSQDNRWHSDLPRLPHFYHLNFCLARAIAPALAVDSEAGQIRLPRLLDELEQVGRPTHSVQPLLLRFQVADSDTVASRLINGVGSTDEDMATDAIWGIIHWVEFRGIANLPPPPPRLFERLSMFMATRSSDRMSPEFFGTLEAILAHDPDILPPRAVELLEIALDALQTRAAYPRSWHQRDRRSLSDPVPLRRNAVALASAMARSRISDHTAIRDWLEIGRTDPLWVVRMALKESVIG